MKHIFVIARLIVLAIVILLSSCGGSSKYANRRLPVSVESRISDVDIVIVGQLTRHDERAFYTSLTTWTNPPFTNYYYYDLLWIRVHEVLKGDVAGDEIVVQAPAVDQTHPDQNRAELSIFSYFNINEPGIWLIEIFESEEFPLWVLRGNYLPLDDYEAVKAAISDSD